MSLRILGRHFSALAALSTTALATNLPYNPTRILIPANQDGGSYAYIIDPGTDSTASAEFYSLDLTGTLDATNLTLNSLSSSLPFLNSSSSIAYTSLVDSAGNITVFAGDCTSGANGVELYRFQPDASATDGQGTWTKDTTTVGSTAADTSLAGANFLNGGVAYSEVVTSNGSNTDIYVFGGMCPMSDATTSTWQEAANYSQLLVTMTPESSTSEDSDYDLSLVSTSGPPIAEAGFTITGLTPTYYNTTDEETQQQDFVLLGGHTGDAFINMSQAALFSLPQGSWSYLGIDQPSSSTKRGLFTRDTTTKVTPRSGHTAVLSEDGTTIIVYGGWVGDVDTAATPQLAILNIGSGYGGTGSWSWSVPTQSGDATLDSDGVYGHGAVMLPDNVMMIMGGYTISSTTSTSRRVRRSTSTRNTQNLFYNVSSATWISSYTTPASSSSNSFSEDSNGALTTTAQKAGLGVGLTIAIALIIGLIILFVLYYRKRRQRDHHDDKQALFEEKTSYDETWRHTASTDGDDICMNEYGAPNTAKEAFPWLPELGAAGWKSQHASKREVDSTGAFISIPSPTRGLRKGSVARSSYNYQAAPTADQRNSRVGAGIHPIEEIDEEGSMSGVARPGAADAERRHRAAREIFDSDLDRHPDGEHPDDPFRDPDPNPLGSHPVSPDPEYGMRRSQTDPVHASTSIIGSSMLSVNKDQITNWVNEWSSKNPHQEMHSYEGRLSPSKSIDDRTSSTLSERSTRSNLSTRSVARTTSTRSHAFFGLAGAPRISPNPSPIEDRFPPGATSGNISPSRELNRNRSATAPANRSDSRMSFGQLREESDALLGASANPIRMSTTSGRKRAHHRRGSSTYSQDTALTTVASGALPPTISVSDAPKRQSGWMGSIRRALGAQGPYDRTVSASLVHSNTISGSQMQYAPYRDRSNSPTKSRPQPRRTASDSSTFLRLKRGQDDWPGNGEVNAWEPYQDEPDTGDWGEPEPSSPELRSKATKKSQADIDWDIEKAAERRDVQVMFTVPKARLRVVNPDDDIRSMRSVSEGGHSRRSNSNRSRNEREREPKMI